MTTQNVTKQEIDAKTLAISASRLSYRVLHAVGLNPVRHDDHAAARVELLAEAVRELADAVEKLAAQIQAHQAAQGDQSR